jgi:hypothetical protein
MELGGRGCGLDSAGSLWGAMADVYECDNEYSGSFNRLP